MGARLLMNTRAQGMVFLGGPEADPLRQLFGELIQYDDVKRHLAGIVSGLDIRYELGGEHPLVGRRIAHRTLVLADGETSTTALLHPARGVLLDLGDSSAVRGAAAAWQGRVDVVTASAKPVDGGTDPLAGAGAVLVRPDGYVAWAGDSAEGLSDALSRWFGPAGS